MRELHNAVFDALTMEKAHWWRGETRVWSVGSGVGLYGFVGRFVPEVYSYEYSADSSHLCLDSLSNRLTKGG